MTRRIPIGYLPVVLLGIVLSSPQAEARLRFGRGSFFGRAPSARMFSFSRRSFGNRRFSRQPVGGTFIGNSFVPLAPIPVLSTPNRNGHNGLVVVQPITSPVIPVTPPTRPVAYPLPTDRKVPAREASLSEFCDSACTEEYDPHECWVPSAGQLQVVPFSYRGSNFCSAMGGICRDIRKAGQDPDASALVCKRVSSDEVVLRRGEKSEAPKTSEWGKVTGTLGKLSGDLQPGTEPRGDLKRTWLKNHEIAFFPGKLSRGASPREIDTEGKTAAKTVWTDESGKFEAQLPPGEYTVVAKIGGQYRHHDGAFPKDGEHWSTIWVKADGTLEYSIVDNSEVTH